MKFLLDHGLTLLTGAFAGAALTIGLNSFESISFWIWSLLTFSILIIAFRKLIGALTAKGESILRVEYLPACLFCFLIGAGLTGTFTWGFWSVTSSVGSLLAGTGTVGLLLFGWSKADEWLKQRETALTDEVIKTLELANSDLEHLKALTDTKLNEIKQLNELEKRLNHYKDQVYENLYDPFYNDEVPTKISAEFDREIDQTNYSIAYISKSLDPFKEGTNRLLQSIEKRIIYSNSIISSIRKHHLKVRVKSLTTISEIYDECTSLGTSDSLDKLQNEIQITLNSFLK